MVIRKIIFLISVWKDSSVQGLISIPNLIQSSLCLRGRTAQLIVELRYSQLLVCPTHPPNLLYFPLHLISQELDKDERKKENKCFWVFFFSGLDRIIYLSFATMTIDKVNVFFGMEIV